MCASYVSNVVDARWFSPFTPFFTFYLMLISDADARNSNGLCREFILSSLALRQLLFNWIQFPLVGFIARPWGKQLTNMGTQPQQTFWEEEDEEMQGRGTTISGQSMSTSRSLGSPSSRSEQTMATPASDSTFLRLNHLDIHGDDAGSQGTVAWVLHYPLSL